jgi:hypothetical protein
MMTTTSTTFDDDNQADMRPWWPDLASSERIQRTAVWIRRVAATARG